MAGQERLRQRLKWLEGQALYYEREGLAVHRQAVMELIRVAREELAASEKGEATVDGVEAPEPAMCVG